MDVIFQYIKKFLPFLFVRNWYTGQLEVSIVRTIAFVIILGVLIMLLCIGVALGRPVLYSA